MPVAISPSCELLKIRMSPEAFALRFGRWKRTPNNALGAVRIADLHEAHPLGRDECVRQ